MSKDNIILILPDWHQNYLFCDAILNKEGARADKIIFLGDEFDSFKSPPEVYSFKKTCKVLKYLIKEHIYKDKFIFILGNHTLSYIYNNNKSGYQSTAIIPRYYCSGVTKSKISDFRKEFFNHGLCDDFFIKHFKLAYKLDGWLFSHAGVANGHIPYGHSIDRFVEEVCPAAWSNFRNLSFNYNYLLSDVGENRGGDARIGGMVWQDWKTEFFASQDIGRQVMGHTTVSKPEVKGEGTDYESWNIDCGQSWYGIIENGKFIPVKL